MKCDFFWFIIVRGQKSKYFNKHFHFPLLKIIFTAACECNEEGSTIHHCNEDGKCSCKENVTGDKCGECAAGFTNFPDCNECAAEFYGEDCTGKYIPQL